MILGKHGPRRGSLGFWHRSRARDVVPRVRAWNLSSKGLLGLAGYKAGMTHVVMVDDSESPLKGQRVTKAVTVIEVPAFFIYSIVGYEKSVGGLRKVVEVVAGNVPKELRRAITVAKKAGELSKLDSLADKLAEVRVIACTLPKNSGLGKKTPEVFELAIGGNVKEQVEFAKGILGKRDLKARDVLQEGEYVDAIAVSRGKGWQGVVKRRGVSLNIHKATKTRRHGGSIGPEKQAKVMYTIPRAGQMGFHHRVDHDKRVLKVGSAASEVTPSGGFSHYGNLKNEFLLLEGSVPGPSKRLIKLRKAMSGKQAKKPSVQYVSLDSNK